MSQFTNDPTQKELRQAYLSANEDEGQKEAIADWESTVDDGIDEMVIVAFTELSLLVF